MKKELKINWILTSITILMYLGVMGYLIYYIEDFKKHPCQICAEKTGKDITCFAFDGNLVTFDNDGSINSRIKIRNPKLPENFTIVNSSIL